MTDLTNAILLCLGILLAGAEHAPDAPTWAWAINITGVSFIGLLAWRCQDRRDQGDMTP